MLVQKQVGPVSTTSSISAGVLVPGRTGNMGEDIVSELHGRYYEATYRRSMFTAGVSTLIATATTASPTTTITGAQVLYNPIGNTVNVVLNKVALGFALANLAGVVGIATGYNGSTAISGTLTTVTATPKSRFVGPGAALATTGFAMQQMTYDLEGGIILPPGGYATIWSNFIIPASSLLSTFQWEEVPV